MNREQAWNEFVGDSRTISRMEQICWDAGYTAALTVAAPVIEALREIVEGYPEFQHAASVLAEYDRAVPRTEV